MERVIETSPPAAISVPPSKEEETHKTPPRDQTLKTQLNSPFSIDGSRRSGTPDRLKVPKPFKFPERYTSPTDSMMSPVSKRLLSKSRKSAPLLPPTINPHHKIGIQESRLNDTGLLQS